MAAAVAVALHGVMLAPPVLWAPTVRPPDIVATVELTPLPEDEAASGTPDTPMAEGVPAQPALQPAPQSAPAVASTEAPPSDSMKTVQAAEAPIPPPPMPEPPTPAEAAIQPPEPAQALASSEAPTADVPAEVVRGVPPPPDAVIAEAPPVPAAVTPVAPVMPEQPRPMRPVPPRPVVRPVPRLAPARATPSSGDTSASTAATAPSAAPASAATSAAAPPGAAPSASAPSPTRSPHAVTTWSSELSAQLQRAKRYPGSARDRGEQGVATATFTMDRGGHVLSAALVRSSGSRALDEEAVALIHRAEPLPPMPPDMPGSTITLTVPIAFSFH